MELKSSETIVLSGKFLWMPGPAEGQLRSGFIRPTSSHCYLELALYQVEMKGGLISLIIETFNRTSYVAAERMGNNLATLVPFHYSTVANN
jgi:hypothetical protein